MQVKDKLEMAAMLIDVQRVRKIAFEVALADAREAEHSAWQKSQVAYDENLAAQANWLNNLSRPGFSPEISQLLSQRLIEREHEAETAALGARIASDVRVHRQQEWQMSDAQARSSRETFRILERKARRRREEKELEALADRTTYAWSRR